MTALSTPTVRWEGTSSGHARHCARSEVEVSRRHGGYFIPQPVSVEFCSVVASDFTVAQDELQ
eukprot:scaffold112649_cov72-Phaeocystis_antarctica.AAC.1